LVVWRPTAPLFGSHQGLPSLRETRTSSTSVRWMPEKPDDGSSCCRNPGNAGSEGGET
jgi:hypothetical protein